MKSFWSIYQRCVFSDNFGLEYNAPPKGSRFPWLKARGLANQVRCVIYSNSHISEGQNL